MAAAVAVSAATSLRARPPLSIAADVFQRELPALSLRRCVSVRYRRQAVVVRAEGQAGVEGKLSWRRKERHAAAVAGAAVLPSLSVSPAAFAAEAEKFEPPLNLVATLFIVAIGALVIFTVGVVYLTIADSMDQRKLKEEEEKAAKAAGRKDKAMSMSPGKGFGAKGSRD
eukprot:jgi/Chlat1/6954/Chrsp52S06625